MLTNDATRNRLHEAAPGVSGLQIIMVNAYFVGERGSPWVLIDAGLPFSAARFVSAAAELFGEGSRPAAILMTHAHFDHVGALKTLAERWDVPVYAHSLELPYLKGQSKYPPPDPTVGGGAMAMLSPLYPRGPVDLGTRVEALPGDGSVPFLPGWRWIHTPGHTPGHVSFFRESDRTLIAGDAAVTTKQESFFAVMTQKEEIHAPPAYYTSDWDAAKRSVERLAALEPRHLATGHGVPLQGSRATTELRRLARDFEEIGRPKQGRYVDRPAISDERGVVWAPPYQQGVRTAFLAAAVAVLAAGAVMAYRKS